MVNHKRNILFIVLVTVSVFSLGQKIKFIEIYNENGLVEKKKSNDNNPNNLINGFYLSNIENGYLTTTIDYSRIFDKTLFIQRGAVMRKEGEKRRKKTGTMNNINSSS